jgi:hypothetical protein
MNRRFLLMATLASFGAVRLCSDSVQAATFRRSPRLLTRRTPNNEAEFRYWLQNMIIDHRFSLDEVTAATGLESDKIKAALARFEIDPSQRPKVQGQYLRILPYPGGRHTYLGTRDGAVDQQRETKISVFTPWDPESYVVVDIPEAIWSNLGLTYLAHMDIETIWEQRGIVLEPLEWTRHVDGSLSIERELPNGIRFGTKAVATRDAVHMEMWLSNHTESTLTGLHVQACVSLKGAGGFQRQAAENKVYFKPYAAAPYEPTLDRWVITAWEPCVEVWGNHAVPCIHSDPQFPDCPAGQTQRVRGRLSFYEGRDIQGEMERIDVLGWRTA